VNNEPSPFGQSNTIAEHVGKKERRARLERDVLCSVASDDTLDTLDIVDKDFNESFSRIIAIQSNPGIPEAHKHAMMCLYRLYVQREQIAIEKHQPNTGSFNFMVVLNRLLDDL